MRYAEFMTKTEKTLTAIANKHLDLETLETRNSDDADFAEHAIWEIKDALAAAFAAGQKAARK